MQSHGQLMHLFKKVVERAEVLSMRNRDSVDFSMEELHFQMLPANARKTLTGCVVRTLRVSELKYRN